MRDLRHTFREHTKWPKTVTFISDGQLLASSSAAFPAIVSNVSTGALLSIIKPKAKSLTAVAMSADRRLLAYGTSDGSVKAFDLINGALL